MTSTHASAELAQRRGPRALVGVADQLLFSLSNFLLTILVARSVSAEAFGAFALAMAVHLLSLAVLRGLTSEALIVRFSAVPENIWRRGAEKAIHAALAFGMAVGSLLLVAGLLLPGVSGTVLVVLGVAFPALAVQDFLRYAALAAGRPAVALADDALQVLVMFGGVAWVIASGQGRVWQFVLAWGLGGLVGAVVGAILLRLVPGLRRTRSWFVDNGDLAARYAFDDFAGQGTQQLTNFVVAGFAGLKDAGALRGAQSAFAPPSILGLGLQGAAIPELVRALRRSTKKLHRDVLALSAGLATISLVWGIITLTVPDSVGKQLFGDTWQAAEPLLIYYCVAQVANGVRRGPEVGLRALGAADRTVRARVWVSMIGVAGQVAGALVAGALGVAVATAIIKPFEMVIWYLYYRGARLQATATGLAFLTQLGEGPAAPDERRRE